VETGDAAGNAAAAAMWRHADRLDDLRYRLESVAHMSTFMPRDTNAYGAACAWIADAIEYRIRDQDELVDYTTENLRIAAKRIRRAAAVYETSTAADRATRSHKAFRASYWYSKSRAEREERGEPQKPWEPRTRAADKYQGLVDRIASREWAEQRLTAVAPSGIAGDDAFGGVADHFVPMREALAQLVGNAATVAAQSRAWSTMGAELYDIAVDLECALDYGLDDWTGEDHVAYQELMSNNVDAIGALSRTAAGLGAAVEGAGAIAAVTLDLVREQSAELAARMLLWSAAPGAVAPRHLIAAVTKWALMVMTYLAALGRSLENLRQILGRPRSSAG
jgi:hypothetical protein